MTTVTKARLIQTVDGKLTQTDFDIENIIAAMSVRGFEFIDVNSNPRQRAELQGQPKFKGVTGPMWDGDAIRYECPESYAQISA